MEVFVNEAIRPGRTFCRNGVSRYPRRYNTGVSEKADDAIARIEQHDGADAALEVSAAFAAAAPWVGGAISNYLNGKVMDRKFRRVAEELKLLADDMARKESETARAYV